MSFLGGIHLKLGGFYVILGEIMVKYWRNRGHFGGPGEVKGLEIRWPDMVLVQA